MRSDFVRYQEKAVFERLILLDLIIAAKQQICYLSPVSHGATVHSHILFEKRLYDDFFNIASNTNMNAAALDFVPEFETSNLGIN